MHGGSGGGGSIEVVRKRIMKGSIMVGFDCVKIVVMVEAVNDQERIDG